MKRWARIAAIFGLLAVALIPAGRGQAARLHQVPSNILLIALGSEPNTFDPAQDVANGSMEYYGTAYEGLTAYKVKGDWGAAWFDEHTDGTGPYTLQSWTHNQQAIWVKNPHYWRGWAGKHLDKVIFKIVKEASTQKLLLRQGDADVLLYALTP